MPLIVIVGLPCSGKTAVSEVLCSFLRSKGKEVELVNEESVGISKQDGYASLVVDFV